MQNMEKNGDIFKHNVAWVEKNAFLVLPGDKNNFDVKHSFH